VKSKCITKHNLTTWFAAAKEIEGCDKTWEQLVDFVAECIARRFVWTYDTNHQVIREQRSWKNTTVLNHRSPAPSTHSPPLLHLPPSPPLSQLPYSQPSPSLLVPSKHVLVTNVRQVVSKTTEIPVTMDLMSDEEQTEMPSMGCLVSTLNVCGKSTETSMSELMISVKKNGEVSVAAKTTDFDSGMQFPGPEEDVYQEDTYQEDGFDENYNVEGAYALVKTKRNHIRCTRNCAVWKCIFLASARRATLAFTIDSSTWK